MSSPFVSQPTAEAVKRGDRQARAGQIYAAVSRPVRVTFPSANSRRDVAHGLGETPHGFLVLEADGAVYRALGAAWAGKDVAYLRAPLPNTHATIVFVTFLEEPTDA